MNSRVLLAAPLLLAASPNTVDELSFDPVEGLSLTKTFRASSESEGESQSERSSSSSSSSSERSLVVIDTIHSVADGRTTKLEREYIELGTASESSFEFGGDTHERSSTGTSELEGQTVVFEWDEEEEEMVATSDDVDDEVLGELAYDFDFALFLPEDAVSEDDEWTIDLEGFSELANPWKGVPWETEMLRDGEVVEIDDSDAGDFERPEPEIDESKEGELRATYRGTRDEDGVTVAVIELEGEIEIERTISSSYENETSSSTTYNETSETRTVTGEVLWNVEGGHLHSVEIETESESSSTSEHSFRFGDREHNSTSESEREGKTTFSVTFERNE